MEWIKWGEKNNGANFKWGRETWENSTSCCCSRSMGRRERERETETRIKSAATIIIIRITRETIIIMIIKTGNSGEGTEGLIQDDVEEKMKRGGDEERRPTALAKTWVLLFWSPSLMSALFESLSSSLLTLHQDWYNSHCWWIMKREENHHHRSEETNRKKKRRLKGCDPNNTNMY